MQDNPVLWQQPLCQVWQCSGRKEVTVADKVIRVDNGVKVRVDKHGQTYWDWGLPKAKPKEKAPKKRGA